MMIEGRSTTANPGKAHGDIMAGDPENSIRPKKGGRLPGAIEVRMERCVEGDR